MGKRVYVINPGLMTTIQDSGRIGYRQYGVVTSGAMDAFALRVANMLVGNEPHAGALETTLKGPTLKWLADGWIAICGGDLGAKIDGIPVPLWRPIYVKRQSVLTFQYAQSGCRAYIAIQGGIAVPEVLGSLSTHVHAGIGGLDGRALQAGDTLHVHSVSATERKRVQQVAHSINEQVVTGAGRNRVQQAVHSHDVHGVAGVESSRASAPMLKVPWFVSYDLLPRYSDRPVVRLIKSSEFMLFDEESQRALFSESFKVKPQSDRMGIQLSGPSLQLREADEARISGAVTMGTIQVPPSGDPIILMADGQTVGGYPVIAYVATVDLPLLAQLKPIDQVQFTAIALEEAEMLYRERELELNMLKVGLGIKGFTD